MYGDPVGKEVRAELRHVYVPIRPNEVGTVQGPRNMATRIAVAGARFQREFGLWDLRCENMGFA
jgi:hypothetical protein